MTPLEILATFMLLSLLVAVVWYCLAGANKPQWWQCSWCKIHFNQDGQTSVEQPDDWDGVQTSHGMCPECVKLELEKLDRLSPPVSDSSASPGQPPWR